MSHAVVLLGHGSRDAGWRRPMDEVARRMRERAPHLRVACAFLDLQPPDLPTAVADLAAAGVSHVRVVPMFLGLGKHAREDLPALVQAARERHPDVQLTLESSVGEHPDLLDLIAALAARQA